MRKKEHFLKLSKPFIVLIFLVFILGTVVIAQTIEEKYKRAEQFSQAKIQKLMFKTEVKPNWIGESDSFWYLNKTRDGKKFIFVDPKKKVRRLALDHEKLALSLSEAAEKKYKADKLPFHSIDFINEGKAIVFEIGSKIWTCDLVTYACTFEKKKKALPANHLVSPDGKWALFKKDHNLYLKPIPEGDEIQLTADGEEYDDYSTRPSFIGKISGAALEKASPPLALWSPDSKKIVTHRLDVRKVKDLHLLKFSPPGKSKRPKLYTYKYPMPEDKELGLAPLMIFDVETKSAVAADYGPELITFMTPFEKNHVWWSDNSQSVYFIHSERGDKAKILCEVDARTGMTREIIEERGNTHVELNIMISLPNVRILGEGEEIIWYSQRDGWAHLYLYDGQTGKLKNQITQGQWVVRDIMHLDEKDRWVYFTASGKEEGRDPYLRHLYRVKLDGSKLQLLTPEDADHEITSFEMALSFRMKIHFSPSGKYFVDTYSRADLPPVSVLKSSDGKLVQKLEEADIEKLLETGWKFPTPFKVKARDGETDIYGLLIYPTDFDPSKKYPLIDSIYPGPQITRTPKSFSSSLLGGIMFWGDQALAELGFIVVNIDGMGTSLRSKTFHDVAYGNLGEAGGLKDHIEGFKQLAVEHPYLDLERIGIYGTSGGGFATARAMLEFPDFYKVGVSSAGNHDQRGYIAAWGEKYQGLLDGDNYKNQVTAELAKNLKGNLFLVHGGMDDNVHPALTFQLVDALIKANKKFDFLIIPNSAHGISAHPYFTLRLWDYFVEHLLGEQPPVDYKLGKKKEETKEPKE